MPKIIRATQLIFGSSAPSTQITAFGTAMTANPVYTTDPAELQTNATLEGWDAAIEADKAPFEEDTNGLFYLITRQLAYLFQQGIPEWDANTTYYQNSQCSVMQDGILVIKRSLTDNNVGNNPATDNVNWVDYFSQRVIHTIGDPIITLNPVLEDNEIWLEGAEVSKTTYASLYAIYGNTYGTAQNTDNFLLPDFRDRVFWGAETFGYLSAGLPNIRGTITKLVTYVGNATGAFSLTSNATWKKDGTDQTLYHSTLSLNASNSNSIYGNANTVRPPAVSVRVVTRYQ